MGLAMCPKKSAKSVTVKLEDTPMPKRKADSASDCANFTDNGTTNPSSMVILKEYTGIRTSATSPAAAMLTSGIISSQATAGRLSTRAIYIPKRVLSLFPTHAGPLNVVHIVHRAGQLKRKTAMAT